MIAIRLSALLLFVTSCAIVRSPGPDSNPRPTCVPNLCEIHLVEFGWLRELCREPCPDGQIRSCACKGMMLPEGKPCFCITQKASDACGKATMPRIDCKPGEKCKVYDPGNYP